MTDTNTLAPTDAELMQVIKDVAKNSAINRDGSTSLRIARAVLAKWGSPVVAVEPWGWHYWNNGGASVLHRGPSSQLDADIEASKQYPKVHHVVPLFTTPQPTQAQEDAKDAERYRFLRDGEWRDTELEPFIRLQRNALWDSKIDAAIAAQQGTNAS